MYFFESSRKVIERSPEGKALITYYLGFLRGEHNTESAVINKYVMLDFGSK